jgi:hypothetical protein
MTLFVGLLWEGYSVASNIPSELSAIGAPTRAIWIRLGMVYGVLMIAFGWIVWASAPPNRALRAVGALLMAHTTFGQWWPPMHQRAVLAAGGFTLTDTLHLVWAAVTGVFFMLIVAFGAAALGKRFRVYSIATMVIVLACGAVTGTYAADVQADLPTPWVGVWERISIATFMAWIVVLAIALLRASRGAAPSVRATSQEKPWSAAKYLVSAIHFPMQRKQLIGIATRAEHSGNIETRGPEDLEVTEQKKDWAVKLAAGHRQP